MSRDPTPREFAYAIFWGLVAVGIVILPVALVGWVGGLP